MANLEELDEWEDGIYQFEETDFIEGGANGIDNLPHKQLGARTKFLKAKSEAIEVEIANLVSNNYTKTEIDILLQGLKPKASAKVATTANISLTGTQSIDGIAVAVGDRVLVKDQTTASQNGIYIVSASAWTRSLDTNTALEVTGAFVFVEQGTINADTAWVQTADNITLNTTSLVWVKFAGSGAFQAASTILSAIAALTSGVGYLNFNNGVVSIDTGKPAGEWVDVTASRTIGVTYTNTTNRKIDLFVSQDSSSAIFMWIVVNGVTLEASYIGSRIGICIPIYQGDTYKITTSNGSVPNDFYKVYERN